MGKYYDYKEGKNRILEIIDSSNEVEETDKVPRVKEFTYENGYYSLVSAIFIDIRKSTELFTNNKKTTVSKVIRSFTSEAIEILRRDDNLREIGIRGDCVYGIYTTPTKDDKYKIFEYATCINTFMNMINKILSKKKMPTIKVGIGVATSKELVVKAGRKESGINNLVWIGDAVSYASKLSNIANRDEYETKYYSSIIATKEFINNIIDLIKDSNKTIYKEDWFKKIDIDKIGECYKCNLISIEFDEWIDNNI